MSVIVLLDDARFGAGPGTVIAHCNTVAEFRAWCDHPVNRGMRMAGTRDPRWRLWGGDAPIGTRVALKPLPCPDPPGARRALTVPR